MVILESQRKCLVTSCAACALLLVSQASHATFGYMSHGYGAKSKAMGGVSTALPLEPLAGLTNPATLVHLGNTWAAGAALFNPNRGYTANNDAAPPPAPSIPPGSFESDNELFLIPSFARNWMLDEHSSVAFLVAGNGGLNTDYDTAVFQNFAAPGVATVPTGVDLLQVAIGISYSRKLNDVHSIGVTPILAIQAFKAEGLEPFQPVSVFPNEVTNNGYDYSYGGGLRIGWMGQLTDRLSVGASWQSKLYMTEFDDYRGLFAEQGDFDIPSIWNLGIAYRLSPQLTVAFDVQEFEFSDVAALGNPNDLPITPNALGGNDGIGFGWEDMTVAKLGLQWEYSNDLTLRAGFSTADQVVPKTQALFNILAPGVTREHFTLGFTRKLDKHTELSMSFMHAPNEKVSGTNPNTGPQTGYIEMDQNELEITYTRQLP